MYVMRHKTDANPDTDKIVSVIGLIVQEGYKNTAKTTTENRNEVDALDKLIKTVGELKQEKRQHEIELIRNVMLLNQCEPIDTIPSAYHGEFYEAGESFKIWLTALHEKFNDIPIAESLSSFRIEVNDMPTHTIVFSIFVKVKI